MATALAEAAAEHTAALRQAEDDAARDAARLQAELKEMAQVGVQGVQLLHSRGKNTSLFTDTQSQVRDAEANARAHLAEELSRAHTEMEEQHRVDEERWQAEVLRLTAEVQEGKAAKAEVERLRKVRLVHALCLCRATRYCSPSPVWLAMCASCVFSCGWLAGAQAVERAEARLVEQKKELSVASQAQVQRAVEDAVQQAKAGERARLSKERTNAQHSMQARLQQLQRAYEAQVRELAARHEREIAKAADDHQVALAEAAHAQVMAVEEARADVARQVAEANERARAEMRKLLEVELERCREAEARRSEQERVSIVATARNDRTQALAEAEERYVGWGGDRDAGPRTLHCIPYRRLQPLTAPWNGNTRPSNVLKRSGGDASQTRSKRRLRGRRR